MGGSLFRFEIPLPVEDADMVVAWAVTSGTSGLSRAAPGTGGSPVKAAAERALDKPAFTATPGELLALGKVAPTGDWTMVILRDQREVSYDDRSRATVRERRVYVIQSEDGNALDDSIDTQWHTSYQDRPVIRARVITPAGAVEKLDPARITEPAERPQLNQGSPEAWEFNYVAWHRLGVGRDLTAALDLARKAVDKAPREAGIVNTLAAIEVEHGDLGRAIQDNRKAMELRSAVEPDAGDWYVAGRIDEQLGLTADAIAAYRRVTRPEVDQLLGTYELAQRRLAALGAAH